MFDRRLDEIVGWFAGRGLPCCFWVGPSSQPDDLGERLLARGFDLIFHAPGITHDLAAVSDAVPAGCVIERVRDDDGLRAFLAVILGAYDRPADPHDPWFPVYAAVGYDLDSPVRHYLGFVDAEPVGAATGVIAAGIVGIYHVHVLPRFRGRGLSASPIPRSRSAPILSPFLSPATRATNPVRPRQRRQAPVCLAGMAMGADEATSDGGCA